MRTSLHIAFIVPGGYDVLYTAEENDTGVGVEFLD
jgi:hypothetical protein